jgi:hypothetical protein
MSNDTIHLDLSLDEVNLILEGLGELPFRRVFQLGVSPPLRRRRRLGGDGVE